MTGTADFQAAAFPAAGPRLSMRRQDGGGPVSGGDLWGVPLGVGGPPAGNFIFWRADQDTQDIQDTHDGGKVGLRAEPLSHWVCYQYEVPSRRSPGSLGCPGCLGQGVGARSGQVPIWPLARRQYAARGAPQTCPPRLAAEGAPPRWRRSQSVAAFPVRRRCR